MSLLWLLTCPLNRLHFKFTRQATGARRARTLDAMHGRVQGPSEHRPDFSHHVIISMVHRNNNYVYIYICVYICMYALGVQMYIDTNIPSHDLQALPCCTLHMHPWSLYMEMTIENELAVLPKSRPTCLSETCCTRTCHQSLEKTIDDWGYFG